jgi:hypothetical protein
MGRSSQAASKSACAWIRGLLMARRKLIEGGEIHSSVTLQNWRSLEVLGIVHEEKLIR